VQSAIQNVSRASDHQKTSANNANLISVYNPLLIVKNNVMRDFTAMEKGFVMINAQKIYF